MVGGETSTNQDIHALAKRLHWLETCLAYVTCHVHVMVTCKNMHVKMVKYAGAINTCNMHVCQHMLKRTCKNIHAHHSQIIITCNMLISV